MYFCRTWAEYNTRGAYINTICKIKKEEEEKRKEKTL